MLCLFNPLFQFTHRHILCVMREWEGEGYRGSAKREGTLVLLLNRDMEDKGRIGHVNGVIRVNIE